MEPFRVTTADRDASSHLAKMLENNKFVSFS